MCSSSSSLKKNNSIGWTVQHIEKTHKLHGDVTFADFDGLVCTLHDLLVECAVFKLSYAKRLHRCESGIRLFCLNDWILLRLMFKAVLLHLMAASWKTRASKNGVNYPPITYKRWGFNGWHVVGPFSGRTQRGEGLFSRHCIDCLPL